MSDRKIKEKLILFQQRDNVFMSYWDKFPEDIKYQIDEDLRRLIAEVDDNVS